MRWGEGAVGRGGWKGGRGIQSHKECPRILMGAPSGGPALGALGSVPLAAAPPVRPELRPVPTGIGTKAARGTALSLFQCGREGRSGDVGSLIRTDRCYDRQTVPLADLPVHCSPCPLGLCSVWIGLNRLARGLVPEQRWRGTPHPPPKNGPLTTPLHAKKNTHTRTRIRTRTHTE